MTYKNFEDFMMQKFAQAEPTVLDDEFPDAFEGWICDLNADQWIGYGDEYRRATPPVSSFELDESEIEDILKESMKWDHNATQYIEFIIKALKQNQDRIVKVK